MSIDTIADFLTRIRNASLADHDQLQIAYSSVREAIASILKQEGYIRGFTTEEGEPPHKLLVISLQYHAAPGIQRKSRIRTLRRVSKPGRRLYVNHKNIPRPLRGMGTVIISTSDGIITGKEAMKRGLGGEIICVVW